MNLVAAIERRRSVRRYIRRPVPPSIVRQVVAAGRNAVPLRPEIGIRWYIVWDGSALARCLTGLAGVYGLFVSAPHYVIAVSQERPGFMENLGFCMEQLILAATALGLGTCWIGGMFTEGRLRDFVPDQGPDERIVALTPLGYADESPSAQVAQHLLRWGSERQGARKPLQEIVSRDTWAIPWTSHLQPTEDETLNRVFELTRLAPSWANTQPWHFVVDEVANDRGPQEAWTVIATVNHKPQRGNIREGKPYYRLDGGIAMCHFYLAAHATGWPGQWISTVTERPPGEELLRANKFARRPWLHGWGFAEPRAEGKRPHASPLPWGREADLVREASTLPNGPPYAADGQPHHASRRDLRAMGTAVGVAQIRARYGIPAEYDILGIFVPTA